MGEPYVCADGTAVADLGGAAENGGVGVDDAVITDIGVALSALYGITVLIKLKALCAEGNALIYLYVVADGGGLTDYDTCAVVDEEILTDRCAGVDIYARFLVGKLGHNTRDIRNSPAVEAVGDAVYRNCIKSGV